MFCEFFDTTAVKIVYMDTGKIIDVEFFVNKSLDSFFLAMSRPLDQLVKPEKKYEWDNGVKQQWFVQNYDDIYETKQPGLFPS